MKNNNKNTTSRILLTPEVIMQIEAAIKDGSPHDSAVALLKSTTSFLMTYCPKSEQDLEHVEELVKSAEVSSNCKANQSDYGRIMTQTKMVDANSEAVRNYELFCLMTDNQTGYLCANYVIGTLLIAIAHVKGTQKSDVKEELKFSIKNSYGTATKNINTWVYMNQRTSSQSQLQQLLNNKWDDEGDEFFF